MATKTDLPEVRALLARAHRASLRRTRSLSRAAEEVHTLHDEMGDRLMSLLKEVEAGIDSPDVLDEFRSAAHALLAEAARTVPGVNGDEEVSGG